MTIEGSCRLFAIPNEAEGHAILTSLSEKRSLCVAALFKSVSRTPDLDIKFGIGSRVQLTDENAWLRVKPPGTKADFGIGQSKSSGRRAATKLIFGDILACSSCCRLNRIPATCPSTPRASRYQNNARSGYRFDRRRAGAKWPHLGDPPQWAFHPAHQVL